MPRREEHPWNKLVYAAKAAYRSRRLTPEESSIIGARMYFHTLAIRAELAKQRKPKC